MVIVCGSVACNKVLVVCTSDSLLAGFSALLGQLLHKDDTHIPWQVFQ